MADIKDFEKEVINLLAADVLTPEQLKMVVEGAEVVGCDYSSSGYFLTIRHSLLPQKRTICHRPLVLGHAEGIDCGFVIFIENGELTIECHSWAVDIPEGFRDKNVRIWTKSS